MRIDNETKDIIEICVITLDTVKLPDTPLDRKLYTKVNKALEHFGCKWVRKLKVHQFQIEGGYTLLKCWLETGEIHDLNISVNTNTGHNRLIKLRDETAARGVDMVFDRARFDTLRDNTSKPRAVAAFNLFQTPPDIADRMAAIITANTAADAVILEPSAGLGRLYTALRKAGHAGPVVLAEQSPDCCRELYTLTENDTATILKQGDFLDMETLLEDNAPGVSAVIMNPPFKMGRDIKHILHAFEMLKPGGLLVSLCYNGVRQNKKLKPLADTWEVLPAGSFKSEGTAAEVILLTMIKN